MTAAPPDGWPFVRVGLIVTGDTEAVCLPDLFRVLEASGKCHFKVIRRIDQRSPITSRRRKLRMVGAGRTIPTKDEDEIGLVARSFLMNQGDYVILVDDLESDRANKARQVFERYRVALDSVLNELKASASVHFLVNMLEAYYLANAAAVNGVLGTNLEDFDGDVETIRHPKNDLKTLHPAFDPKQHGPAILRALDVMHVLANPNACASLRTMFAWATTATRAGVSIPSGVRFPVTSPQIDVLDTSR